MSIEIQEINITDYEKHFLIHISVNVGTTPRHLWPNMLQKATDNMKDSSFCKHCKSCDVRYTIYAFPEQEATEENRTYPEERDVTPHNYDLSLLKSNLPDVDADLSDNNRLSYFGWNMDWNETMEDVAIDASEKTEHPVSMGVDPAGGEGEKSVVTTFDVTEVTFGETMHGLDLEAEITKILATELNNKIDAEIIKDLAVVNDNIGISKERAATIDVSRPEGFLPDKGRPFDYTAYDPKSLQEDYRNPLIPTKLEGDAIVTYRLSRPAVKPDIKVIYC